MKRSPMLALAAVVILVSAGSGVRAARQKAPPAEETRDTVRMMELTLDSRRVKGRLVRETEETIRIESLGGGAIGYRKENIREVRRYSIPAADYYAMLGEHYQQKAWELEEAPTLFVKARQAYRKALESAEEDRRARFRRRLEALSEERKEWQEEALRRQRVEKAAQEAELARIEKELAEEKLATVRRHEEVIRGLQSTMREVGRQVEELYYLTDALERGLLNLEDDVEDLERRDSAFITSRIFVDLRSSHKRLERKVDRLERKLRRREAD